MRFLDFTTPQPITAGAAQITQLELTPGASWTVTAVYQSGNRAGSVFRATGGRGKESIAVSGASEITRLEGIRDGALAILGITGATAESLVVRPPASPGNDWSVQLQYLKPGVSRAFAEMTISTPAAVTLLDDLLTDVVGVLQSRSILAAGSITTLTP